MKSCAVCNVKTEHIEIHHKVPQRFDGPDKPWNLEPLCRSCHVAIEKMYNKRFWEYLDMGLTSSKSICDHQSCGAENVRRLKVKSPKIGLMKSRFRHYCYHHSICSFNFCGHKAKPVDKIVWNTTDSGHTYAAVSTVMLCDNHRICTHSGCESRICVYIKKADPENPYKRIRQLLCYSHLDDVEHIDISDLIRVAKRDDLLWKDMMS